MHRLCWREPRCQVSRHRVILTVQNTGAELHGCDKPNICKGNCVRGCTLVNQPTAPLGRMTVNFILQGDEYSQINLEGQSVTCHD